MRAPSLVMSVLIDMYPPVKVAHPGRSLTPVSLSSELVFHSSSEIIVLFGHDSA